MSQSTSESVLVRRYRSMRDRYAPIPAVHALRWAREELPAWIEWSEDRTTYTPRGCGQQDGLDVVLWCEYEPDPMLSGEFSDSWREGAVQNPAWSRGDGRVLRWYLPMASIEEHRAELSKLGYSRAQAYERARQHVMEELRRDREPEQYVIHVDVYKAGICLAQESVGCFDVPEDYAEAGAQLMSQAVDMVPEALAAARRALACLAA